MKEQYVENQESQKLDLSVVDTFVFDYGGVVSFHYCEPWQGNLSTLLNVSPDIVRKLLSESGELGRNYRLGKMSRNEFWDSIIAETKAHNIDPSELEFNWAMSYQIDYRMVELVKKIKKERGSQIGLLSNSDEYRQTHNEAMYNLSKIFDFIISSHTYGVVKPEPESYLKMLEITNREITPNKVIYIDDRERNVIPGQKLGIQGYVFSDYNSFLQLLCENKIIK